MNLCLFRLFVSSVAPSCKTSTISAAHASHEFVHELFIPTKHWPLSAARPLRSEEKTQRPTVERGKRQNCYTDQLSYTGLDISPLPSFGHKQLPAIFKTIDNWYKTLFYHSMFLLQDYTFDIERSSFRKMFYPTSLEYNMAQSASF